MTSKYIEVWMVYNIQYGDACGTDVSNDDQIFNQNVYYSLEEAEKDAEISNRSFKNIKDISRAKIIRLRIPIVKEKIKTSCGLNELADFLRKLSGEEST